MSFEANRERIKLPYSHLFLQENVLSLDEREEEPRPASYYANLGEGSERKDKLLRTCNARHS